MANSTFPDTDDTVLIESIATLFPTFSAKNLRTVCATELYVLRQQLRVAIHTTLDSMRGNRKQQKEFIQGVEKIFIFYILVNTYCFGKFIYVPHED